MEDKKSPAGDKAAAKEKKRKGKKSTAAVAPADAPPEAAALEKPQPDSIVVSAEPVALPADWASGAITVVSTVVSTGAAGEIAVIHADGTQIQPIVTSGGAGVISLDASAVPVPYSENPGLPAPSQPSIVASHAILAAGLQSEGLAEATVISAEASAAEGQRTGDQASAQQEAAGDQV